MEERKASARCWLPGVTHPWDPLPLRPPCHARRRFGGQGGRGGGLEISRVLVTTDALQIVHHGRSVEELAAVLLRRLALPSEYAEIRGAHMPHISVADPVYDFSLWRLVLRVLRLLSRFLVLPRLLRLFATAARRLCASATVRRRVADIANVVIDWQVDGRRDGTILLTDWDRCGCGRRVFGGYIAGADHDVEPKPEGRLVERNIMRHLVGARCCR
mmetsp:Transcript_109931/g.319920  ORF Transcript_109931/g.319920 Transcript_109931/m.319920 type:complete len:216 (+) Transcript_109931:718-1365(+)